jgi:DNA repair exonuclease SbcCD nuclease subunit
MREHKTLFIGDLHVQLNNLEDTKDLFKFIAAWADLVDRVVFLGDIFHTHSVLRQEVIAAVKEGFYEIYEKNKNIQVVVGNHDLVGPKSTNMNACSLTLNHDIVQVIDEPQSDSLFLMVPYVPDHEEFVKICNDTTHPDKPKVLVCHGTFEGAVYENGFPCPDGVDRSRIPFDEIISGHIHMRAEFNGITYVGTPRAISASEANQPKFLMIYNSQTKQKEWIPVGNLCKRYFRFDVKDEFTELNIPSDLTSKDDVRIYVSGSKSFVDEASRQCTELVQGAKIIPIITETLVNKLGSTETKDIDVLIKEYLDEVSDIKPEHKERLWNQIQATKELRV